MEVHNTVEDTVISKVDEIFHTLEKDETGKQYCFCNQCRTDVICYVLNRIPPFYIVSNRGASRTLKETFERQQHANKEAEYKVMQTITDDKAEDPWEDYFRKLHAAKIEAIKDPAREVKVRGIEQQDDDVAPVVEERFLVE